MTLEKLRQITHNLPAETIVLVDSSKADTDNAETIDIEYHSDGRAYLILSNKQ
jgi:hypothetical protein